MFSIISFILATIGTLLKRFTCYLRYNLLDMTSDSISYPWMPVQSADLVTAALQQTLSASRRLKGSCESSLQARIIAPVQDILREEVKYETTNCTNVYLSDLRSKYTVLKPTDDDDDSRRKVGSTSSTPTSSSNASSSSSLSTQPLKQIHHKEKKEVDELPKPRVVVYPPEKVTLGWKTSSPVGSGFSNMGNTCYLNSTLQALFHVPAFVNWLLSDRNHFSKCEMMNGMNHSECLVCAMSKTLQNTHKFNGSSIKPVGIYSKLRAICRHLVHGHQEDAHEFLRYLIEGMERSYLSLYTGIKFDNRSKETTPLNQIFGGYLRNEVTCLECHYVSTTFQHFQDLILDIRTASTVEDALEGYFSKEHLGNGDQAYKCEQCKRRVAATKKFSLERPPKALCIQLKRFGAMGGKNNKHVTFKKWLDITKFRHRPQIGSHIRYKLVALVTHLGHSSSCGHYTAVGQASNGNYYLFDDHMVREISITNVLNTNAYILMYEMEEKKEEVKANRPVKLVQSSSENTTVLHTNGVSSPKSLDRETLSDRSNKPLSRTLSEKSIPQRVATTPISRASSTPSIVPSSTVASALTTSTVTASSTPAPSTSTSSLTSSANTSRTLALVPYSTSDSESEDSPRTESSTSSSFAQKSSGSVTVTVNGDSRKPFSPPFDRSAQSASHSQTNGHNGEKITIESPTKNHKSSSFEHHKFNHGGTWEVTSVARKLKSPVSMNSSTAVNSQSAGGKCSETTESTTNKSQSSEFRRDYHSNSTNHKTVETLEKMNHRGYGYPVNSWAGTKSEIEREIENEASSNKRRFYHESDDDDDDDDDNTTVGPKSKKQKFVNHRNNVPFKDRQPMKNNRFQFRKNDWSRQFNRGRPGGNGMSSRQHFYYQYTMERGKSGWGRPR